MSEAREALFITDGGTIFDPIVPLLRRSNFTIRRTGADVGCVELVQESPFTLVVIEYPVAGLSLDEFVKEIRAPSSASRRAGLMVIADDEEAPSLERLVGMGINRLIRRSHVGSEFLMALADLVTIERREPLRTVLRLQVQASTSSNTILAQTENLSASGMLVRGSTRHFPVGSEIEFQLALPDQQEPIKGRGEIVRHAQRRKERIEGFGVRFTSLSPNGAARLRNFLERN